MAVYTDVSADMLAGFLRDYDIGEAVSFRGIAEGVENSNYALTTDRDRFILTLFEKRVNPADLPWFLGLMEHLAANGLNCPQPIVARDGQALRVLCDRPAAITSFLDGAWPRTITTHHCHALGETLARLHKAGEAYAAERVNALGPQGWTDLLHKCGPNADTVEKGLIANLSLAIDKLVAHWPHHLPRGHIHADLFPDNVFFIDENVSGVIDFLFAATDYLAYDIAICLNAWCFEAGDKPDDWRWNAERGAAMISGYNAVRPLQEAETAALPILSQGAAMRFLLTRLHDWLHTPPHALVTRKDPREYMAKWRFHQTVSDGRFYG